MRCNVLCGLGLFLLAHPAWAEEPGGGPSGTSPADKSPADKTAAGKTAASTGKARPARTSTPARAADDTGKGTSSSGATETVALEIVAKAPKPIPPVELDMLQLRLMLTDLKASFADEIDRALFREPF